VPDVSGPVLCFGELLLRLGAPGHERLLQSPRLDVQVGGAEANVAGLLAQFGHAVGLIGVVGEGPLGEAALGELRRLGVDTSRVMRRPGRIGLYFFEQGAIRRPSEVVYDRAHSAFASAPANGYDWPALLRGASRLHLSGVTPALGAECAQTAIDAARAARDAGIAMSFDGNFRARLWQAWGGEPARLLRPLMECADVLFANHRDIGLVLGEEFTPASPREAFRAAAEAAFTAFPRLRHFSATVRLSGGVQQQELGALMALRDGRLIESAPYLLDGIVDRIGGGDAFAAGLLHGLHAGYTEQDSLDFALASGAFKHTVPGDISRASVAEIRTWMQAEGADVRR
jgi:2-dehydro-3-deoxygluconokinase